MMLYGVLVDNVLGATANSFASDDPLCPAHWAPLDQKGATQFLNRIRPIDVAAMISAKSGTLLAVKRAAFANFRATSAIYEARAECGAWTIYRYHAMSVATQLRQPPHELRR